MSQSSNSLIPLTPENHSSSPYLPPHTPPPIRRSSTPALDLTPLPPRFDLDSRERKFGTTRSTLDFEELPVVADTPSSQIEPQDPPGAVPTSPNQELYCLTPLRDTNYMRASVESVPDVDHQHGDDDYEDMDYGEDDYGDMEGGEIDGVGREVRGSEDSLAGFFRKLVCLVAKPGWQNCLV
ncbi:hypothetical protein BDD12DRAFT_899685 [Trichophaea hybrida]|nr:hypothetical protein BDD12DRAFT_899685 [Trichophaea hybrida]